MANKVEFGISNLHFGTYSVADDGTVTMGTPYHLKGARNFAPEQESNSNTFYADDVAYWAEYTDGGFEGDLEVAVFTDEFKTQFLNYQLLADGGLAQVKNAVKPSVYVAFEIKGDKEKRKAIFYNCSLGANSREYATVEENKNPTTEKIGITCIGDNKTGVTMAVYRPTDSGYETLFTNPSAPAFAPESE